MKRKLKTPRNHPKAYAKTEKGVLVVEHLKWRWDFVTKEDVFEFVDGYESGEIDWSYGFLLSSSIDFPE